ncbi:MULTISPECIES: TRAP transporter large permease subunit [unclassified Devosia]|uniref:TRAP transporter large permease n=1 Tax=unclassified Devosia TaxID=196773 RepID=UPI001554D77B|nr:MULTISPECIES: TRAP transporter large permease subunit [unclassified Devosia]
MSLVVLIGSLGVAMAIGMPIAFALMVCAVAMMWFMGLTDPQFLAQKMIDGADSYPLMAIPFFILAGELMTAGGLSRRIVDVAMAMFGHLRGGLGYVVIGTGVILASLSGSAIADTAALAVMLMPLMVRAGYDVGRTSGLMAATGIIAPVIPPSIGFVVLGVTANLSIVKLFMAGIVPGLLMALSLVAAWWFISRRDNVQTLPRQSGRQVLSAIRRAIWALLLPVIIVVGLRMGVFTPTEAGIVAAAYAMLVSVVIYREMTFRGLYNCLLASAKLTAIIMLLVAASSVSGFLITVANVPAQVIGLLSPFIDQPILVMALMMLGVFIIGSVLDFTPSITILVPVLMPVVNAAGIDPIYFGVVFIICAAIGMITPPVGAVLNTVSGVARIPLERSIVGVLPFLLAECAVLILLILFPAIVTAPLSLFF